MLKIKRQDVPDVNTYEERLNKRGFIYFNKNKALKTLPFTQARRATLYNHCLNLIRVESSGAYIELSDKSIYEYLINYENCPSYSLKANNKRGFSIQVKGGLDVLLEKGYAEEFLSTYIEYRQIKSSQDSIESICKKYTELAGKNIYGDDLYKIKFSAKQDVNLRFNYTNYNVVTIPKIYNSCISVPEGYVMAWGDFEQSDLRIAYNLFIRDEENAKIMDECADKYEGIARIVCKANNEEFNLEQFKNERQLYKTYILGTMYGKSEAKTEKASAFIKKLTRFLEQCPKYIEYKNTLAKLVNLDTQLYIDSYFGHTEIKHVDYKKSNSINFALNSPIQSGTSELMILTVNKILDKFYELGYTEEDISVYYCRHDEPLFIMKEKVLDDSWVFKDFSTIIVDNWTPLEMDFKFGYEYKEIDKTLMQLYENNCKVNEDKIQIVEQDSEANGYYFPVDKILELSIGYYTDKEADKTSLCVYNNAQKKYKCYELDTADKVLIYNSLVQILKEMSTDIAKKGYSIVTVENILNDIEIYENRVLFKLVLGNTYNTNKANIIAELKYAKQYPSQVDSNAIKALLDNNKWLPPMEEL